MPIRFFSEEIDFTVSSPRKLVRWIKASAKRERREVNDINFIFCQDKYLLRINRDYLKHKTFTDIITFDYSEGTLIQGDIFISWERVLENSSKYECFPEDELHRVMIHGILHLCGYKDKKASDITVMRKKEEAYLSLWKKMFHVKR